MTHGSRRAFTKGDADAWAERRRALQRFSDWESKHPRKMTGQAALNGVGFLYDLLPADARHRSVDTTGVQAMHRALSVLARGAQ